jgi:hypothetical protein
MSLPSFPRLAALALALPAGLLASLVLASSAQASSSGWQSVAAGCVPSARSSKLVDMPITKFGGLTTGAVGFKFGKTGTITLVCPMNFSLTGNSNTLDQLSLVSSDNSPAGSVTATLLRMDRTTGVVETVGSVTSVDTFNIGTQLISFPPTMINFFSHGMYVELKITQSDPLAGVRANMVYLSQSIP